MSRLSKSGEIAHVSNSNHISITPCKIKGGSAIEHLRLLAYNFFISSYRTDLTRVHKPNEFVDSRTYGTRILCNWRRSITQQHTAWTKGISDQKATYRCILFRFQTTCRLTGMCVNEIHLADIPCHMRKWPGNQNMIHTKVKLYFHGEVDQNRDRKFLAVKQNQPYLCLQKQYYCLFF